MADEYNPPPVNAAFNGKKRQQQIEDRIDYETNGPKENDGSKSREVRIAKPDKSTRTDPVGYMRGKLTDAMVAVHNRFSDRKID